MKRLLVLASAALCAWAHAGEGQSMTPLRDPYVPPAVREHARPSPETRGAALHAQVERKLRDSFDAADTQRQGSITREQARAARLGFVADNFDAIDAARSGRVSFDDVKRYLRARGARTL
jgi:hypothetical protein